MNPEMAPAQIDASAGKRGADVPLTETAFGDAAAGISAETRMGIRRSRPRMRLYSSKRLLSDEWAIRSYADHLEA